MFVVDPSAEDGFRQARVDDDAVNNGENITLNKSFDITLEEFAPVALASASFEVDDFLGIPTDGKFTGATVAVWTLLDRWGAGQSTTASIEGPCNNGRCYDLVYTIDVLSEPPPLTGLSVEETKAAIPTVVLSKNIPLPSYMDLPEGLAREEGSDYIPNLGTKLYLPSVQN